MKKSQEFWDDNQNLWKNLYWKPFLLFFGLHLFCLIHTRINFSCPPRIHINKLLVPKFISAPQSRYPGPGPVYINILGLKNMKITVFGIIIKVLALEILAKFSVDKYFPHSLAVLKLWAYKLILHVWLINIETQIATSLTVALNNNLECQIS